jgi:hypothetical protein
MDKIKLGQGFNVLPQPKYFMFMDVFCKCKKFQLDRWTRNKLAVTYHSAISHNALSNLKI